ncbi:TPA: hypothetical protein GHF72_20225 [Providencia stuartii]|nr:hypothetical protein AL507_20345 [Providencia stuartii]AVL41735.1 hypothetical protein CEP70_18060 [Providencia stuartii]AXO19402.1 hypothetical protein MC79_012760 [Providencia stuartii]OMH49974.1 hypothetical protein BTZ17_19870 [Providencia stuartii]PNL57050.1 hypothetical protein CEP73_005790 [Providencia stuartii]
MFCDAVAKFYPCLYIDIRKKALWGIFLKFNYTLILISFSYLSLVLAQYIVDSALLRHESCLRFKSSEQKGKK